MLALHTAGGQALHTAGGQANICGTLSQGGDNRKKAVLSDHAQRIGLLLKLGGSPKNSLTAVNSVVRIWNLMPDRQGRGPHRKSRRKGRECRQNLCSA